jgi:hypothetical protein
MTRNRNRKDKARQLKRDGVRHASAARERDTMTQRDRPVQDLLAEATASVAGADPADAAAILPASWQAVCVIGAAAELLAECAGTRDYRGRFYAAREPLDDAVNALRATPALRSAPVDVNPAGSPEDQLRDDTAEETRAAIATACDALAEALGQVPSGIRPPSVSRASRTAGRSARRVSSLYQAPAALPADDSGAAASRLDYVEAGTPAEMRATIATHLRELHSVDPGATTGALGASWYSFTLALVLGQFLANHSEDMAVLHENAMRSWELVFDALDAAPSLPDGAHGLGLNTVPDADPAMMIIAHKGIWDLTLALNWLLPQVADRAASTADRVIAKRCTALCAELADCYTGKLKTFLNPVGRPPGARSAVIRTRSRRAGHAPCQPRRSRRS